MVKFFHDLCLINVQLLRLMAKSKSICTVLSKLDKKDAFMFLHSFMNSFIHVAVCLRTWTKCDWHFLDVMAGSVLR